MKVCESYDIDCSLRLQPVLLSTTTHSCPSHCFTSTAVSFMEPVCCYTHYQMDTAQLILLVVELCCCRCSLMCSQKVAIVHEGRCGSCAPNQLPGGFPFCTRNDRLGVSPVCGKDGVTYRNSIAAGAASVEVASTGTCAAKQCSEEVRHMLFKSSSGSSVGVGVGGGSEYGPAMSAAYVCSAQVSQLNQKRTQCLLPVHSFCPCRRCVAAVAVRPCRMRCAL
jgi:hypothetical protein